ncbi:hypothetical protein [Natrinema sp. SYSU A 869]|uniref:hypothetical protein n=1 Tax=Natrinema sp. SYSU A 869 TaxID=2871694 RepID=UPI001CA449F9|nr:hypothetical protein [Natrinema sp. SYSU A 869]
MSSDTDDRQSIGVQAAVGAILEHPLLGLERQRTALTVASLLGLIATLLASHLGTRVPIADALRSTVTTGLDALSMVFIALVTPTILLVPFCYAAWNGGPGLSFVLPLVPVGIGDAVAGAYVFDLDIAIALTIGAAAAAVALVSADVRRAGSLRFWRTGTVDENQLLFVTGCAITAAVGVGRFVDTAPGYMLEWYAPVGSVWLVTGAVVGCYWLAVIRSAWHTSDDHATVDP